MIIRICAFTEKGNKLAERLAETMTENIVEIRTWEDTDIFVKRTFEIRCPLIFIGAMGIAVRKIAPYVNDKLTDSPVIVIDEKGENVIPVLSGHMGRANRIAAIFAKDLGARAVITTATDVEGKFAVDVFARDNHLGIVNRDGIRAVSEKVLAGKEITIWDRDRNCVMHIGTDGAILYSENLALHNDVAENGILQKYDVIIAGSREYDHIASLALYPKRLYVGIGCKKGTPYYRIEEEVSRVLTDNSINSKEIALIASIDLKAKEYGLNEYASRHNLELITFSADELKMAAGEYTSSEFVKDVTGVDNVCERAAVVAAGEGSKLLVRKSAAGGVTVAIAESELL